MITAGKGQGMDDWHGGELRLVRTHRYESRLKTSVAAAWFVAMGLSIPVTLAIGHAAVVRGH